MSIIEHKSNDTNEQNVKYESMLTTYDNPYNPFLKFKEWYVYDVSKGYNSLALLDRIIITSDVLSPADQELAEEMAIDEIVTENISGMHTKFVRPVPQTNI